MSEPLLRHQAKITGNLPGFGECSLRIPGGYGYSAQGEFLGQTQLDPCVFGKYASLGQIDDTVYLHLWDFSEETN